MDEVVSLEAIKDGDVEAFKVLFFTYHSPLCEYACQFIAEADAEELVQDLMAYVWSSRTSLNVKGSLKAYLFVAVKNRCLNAIRQKKYTERVKTDLQDYFTQQQLDDPDFYLANELQKKINEAIANLPEGYRKTFEMSRYEGFTNAKISSELEISIKTVEYRIGKSLKLLRGKLKGYLTS